jgi:hypothetical protein
LKSKNERALLIHHYNCLRNLTKLVGLFSYQLIFELCAKTF